ncbi:6333_t:CDS:2 [Dentiscutata heterogama]|uniref:6333_t:CDS:1 n=1 Tax=Dentiscutata heterogama TaxID=1316150 RepID=A0ACA9LE16_9GLOM|nr:6333_t:CDS:2 [Dentiscutata heterogama]
MLKDSLVQIAINAREASNKLQYLTAEDRSFALNRIKAVLENKKRDIFKANEQDKQNADKLVKAGTLSASLFKRLDLESGDKFATMLQGISDIDRLPDPIGQITYSSKLDEGLELFRVTCPVGVLLVIFEARPEVVVNITALALKSGNAAILKGGKESILTLTALSSAIQSALNDTVIPPNAIQLVETREEIDALLDLDKYIDLVNYPAACNAAETLLIHRSILSSHLLPLVTALQNNNVLLHLDQESLSQLPPSYDTSRIQSCIPEDFDTEFLDLEMAVKVVSDVEEAIQHINSHGSKHTDAIVTENEQIAKRFMQGVDAAGVYWNASTRFADGFRYGFGAEVGVSTNKTHARGPVGLEGLLIYKYKLCGNGHVVSEFE